MKSILIIFCLEFISINANAQLLFDKRHELETWSCGRKVFEAIDGYISVGYQIKDNTPLPQELSAVFLKTDFNGDTLKSFIIGSGDTAYLNLPGNTSGWNSDETCMDMVKTNDSNYVAVAWDQRFATNIYDYDVMLIKFNKDLDTLWTVSISHPYDTSIAPQSVIQTADGGFVVCGDRKSTRLN